MDERVLERRDSHASSSHEPSLERTLVRSSDLGKHVPKDRNCKICQRTKITRAPCRRRIGRVALRAENFGDLNTADHKVLSEGCESRQKSSICSVQNKNSGNVEELAKVLGGRIGSLKPFFSLTTLWNLARLVKIFNGIIARLHLTDRKNGIAERAARRVKEGTSAVLLHSGLDESWWADSIECYTYLRNVTDLLSDGKTPNERLFGEPCKRTNHSGWLIG